MNRANILVIDDDKMVCDILCNFIQSLGHSATYALRINEGIQKVASESYDLVILDVRLPDGNGLEAIPQIKDSPSFPEVIIITGEGTVDGAQLAVESGSWDYIQKPLSIDTVKLSLIRAIQYRQEKSIPKAPLVLKREGIVGNSNALKKCLDLIVKAKETDVNVLITGETGTGKELFARAIHANSNRCKKDFVVVDCASLPDNLVESTLFGHTKGAFTGAEKNEGGLIAAADGGTLFLDEIGELPLSVQASFLRVLQEHCFRSVGGKQEISSDFRLIAATNRDLEQMSNTGKFRQDLLFRIKSFMVHLPPLRERSEDIIEIAHCHIRKFCDQYQIGSKNVSKEFTEALLTYKWPGNIRELANTIERVISVASDDQTLYPIHLPTDIRTKLMRDSIHPQNLPPQTSEKPIETPVNFPKLKELVESTESNYFNDLIVYCEGNINKVCTISGLSRANVYARLKKYNISKRS